MARIEAEKKFDVEVAQLKADMDEMENVAKSNANEAIRLEDELELAQNDAVNKQRDFEAAAALAAKELSAIKAELKSMEVIASGAKNEVARLKKERQIERSYTADIVEKAKSDAEATLSERLRRAEERLTSRYDTIDDLGERAYTILKDLRMVEETPDE